MTLNGKVVLVAGVGGGLGSAVVSLLASEGATVVGVARTSQALDRVEAHARDRGWKVSGHTADIRDSAEVERLVSRVVHEHRRLDGVSINVGHWIPGGTLLHRLSEDEWTLGLRDNLDPVYRVGRAVIPHFMEQQAGTLVVVSAAPAVRLIASASYCAAKGGLADLVPKLAHDYRAFGIRVNAVLPGSMSNQLDSLDPPPADRSIPLTDETKTSPWEVARAIRYFVSDESRWVTGVALTVDGGATSGGDESPARGT